MATNQVIHGSNRVVENPNRYKLNAVSGQANTYDLEKVPGVITDNGTPYSKAVLDKIDNVLSYLTPNVEKVIGGIKPVPSGYSNLVPQTINQTWSQNSTLQEISGTFDSFIVEGTTYTPTYKWTGDTGFSASSSDSTNFSIRSNSGSTTTRYGNSYWLSQSSRKTYSSNNRNIIGWPTTPTAESYHFYYTIDMGINCWPTFATYIDGTCKLCASIDNINWIDIKNINDNSADLIRANEAYRYFRIEFSFDTTYIYYCYISSLDIIGSSYQNQFTLDNNGNDFVNNQRLLIETTPNIVDIVKTQSTIIVNTLNNTWGGTTALTSNTLSGSLKSDDINWNSTYEWKTNAQNGFFNNQGTLNTRACVWTMVSGTPYTTSEKFLDQEKIKTYSSNSYTEFDINKHISATEGVETFVTKTFDLLKPSTIKLYYRIYFSNLSSAVIEGSNDNLEWTNVGNIVSNEDTIFNSNDYFRYYKLKFATTDTVNSSTIRVYYNYCDSEWLEQQEAPYDVVSNTLNGIDIPTLLQPSTKYELIYKEDTNKFESNGNLILFDITLTEEVNQVDLVGISRLLEPNKIYALCIYGTTTGSERNSIDFGSQPVLSGWDLGITSPFIFSVKLTNGAVIISGVNMNTTSSVRIIEPNISDYEYIKCNGSKNFKAGTRIIIKEV